MKWIRNIIRRICEWNIIMSKTTIASIDMLEGIKEMNKGFKDKIETPKKQK